MPRSTSAPFSGPPSPTTPVYVISVAAELTGLHPQTLRQYDRAGLVSPGRTGGGGRRYSLNDIEALRMVAQSGGSLSWRTRCWRFGPAMLTLSSGLAGCRQPWNNPAQPWPNDVRTCR
jgi:hypothetical protein